MFAVLSDIHSNLEALDAVLAHATGQGAREFVCLGDIVGYGADPVPCLERVLETCTAVVAGNHDLAAAGILPHRTFHHAARSAIDFTRDQLEERHRNVLGMLPLVSDHRGCQLVHASPERPERFGYVRDCDSARPALLSQTHPLALFGHTHVAVAFHLREDGSVDSSLSPTITYRPTDRTLVNVGSVGQPRDHDPRASYVLVDPDAHTIVRHRVEYDVDLASSKIERAALPEVLGRRLLVGL